MSKLYFYVKIWIWIFFCINIIKKIRTQNEIKVTDRKPKLGRPQLRESKTSQQIKIRNFEEDYAKLYSMNQ